MFLGIRTSRGADAAGDSLAAIDELERADAILAASLLVMALSLLVHGESMHFANPEMNRRKHANN
jgi:hypothetical protein